MIISKFRDLIEVEQTYQYELKMLHQKHREESNRMIRRHLMELDELNRKYELSQICKHEWVYKYFKFRICTKCGKVEGI